PAETGGLMGRLDGRVALITGGARGMGKSHVRHFVAEGARVVFGDVLVNNAGVVLFARIAEMPLTDFRRVLEVNAVGCWLGMKAVIDPMTKAGGGSIINVSLFDGVTGAEGLAAYLASKVGI